MGCCSVRELPGSAGAVVLDLVVPAVDLICAVAGALVFRRGGWSMTPVRLGHHIGPAQLVRPVGRAPPPVARRQAVNTSPARATSLSSIRPIA